MGSRRQAIDSASTDPAWLQVEELMKKDGAEFMWNAHLGYILTCPSNLGTGLRAGVHINIPNLSKVSPTHYSLLLADHAPSTRGLEMF